MADDDARISRWDMTASAGMTVSRPFTATTPVSTVTVYTGGTVVDEGGMGGTITMSVPTGRSVPLRLAVDGVVVAVGRLVPSTTGTAALSDPVTIPIAGTTTLTLGRAVPAVDPLIVTWGSTVPVSWS